MHKVVLDGVEALEALAERGTVTEAAASLGLSQSAVTKRLQALERAVARPIVAPHGRRVVLTTEGQEVLDRARPLLAGLRDLSAPRRSGAARWSVCVDDGLATSFAPGVLADALRALDAVRLDVSVVAGAFVAERVRSGVDHLGVGVGIGADDDLVAERLVDEPWALVHAEAGRRPSRGPVLVADGASRATLAADPDLSAREPVAAGSAAAALRLAAAGFGDAVVPVGHVVEADLPRKAYRVLPATRAVVLVARRSIGSFAAFAALRDELRDRAERRVLGKKGGRKPTLE